MSLHFPVPHIICGRPQCSDVDRPHTRINARCNRWRAPLLFLSRARTNTHPQRDAKAGKYHKNTPKQSPLYLFLWWHGGGYARFSTVKTKCINWPLGRRYGERLPWETRLPLTQVNTSDLSLGAARKMWSISRRRRGHRGADCRSSVHAAVSVVTLPRVLPGVLKAYFSMRHLFSRKTRTVWPKAPHKPNKPEVVRTASRSPILLDDSVCVSVCMRARAFLFEHNFRTKLDYYDGLPLKHRIEIILCDAMPAAW